ncbi:YdcF family protein [Haloimpatiens massiliensis]|uniref:YdcF family protein n=1 Tax=Haloimpatiens massiliensis TaxID=1658110 RepID=UPI000C83E56D|nr:YdcF family protein [Haloimpatiens massiliensis]
MNKYNKKLSAILVILGILSLIYYVILLGFNFKISFSRFWLLVGIIFIIGGILNKNNIKIPKKFSGVRKIVKVIICAFIIMFIIIEIPILYYGNKDYTADSDYIIVLGAGLQGRTMSLTLYQRVEKAWGYLKDHPNTKIIVSGGKGANEAISEAEAMEKYFLNKGIERNRIIKEDKSKNTYENLLFSKEKLIQVEGESLEKIKNLKIGVVTSNFHIFRAKMLGNRVGIELQGMPAKVMTTLQLNFYVREALAVVKSVIFDR